MYGAKIRCKLIRSRCVIHSERNPNNFEKQKKIFVAKKGVDIENFASKLQQVIEQTFLMVM